ncbi:SDR family NAD(P)-dependent oxidoreductase [Streptomyces sp. ME18-1-4]|uniref:SDR family NAD(P)-dependent oxidoreductase n=1 Tax=Streptomyces sp. ME18-1-4 TaxID=3028685 RepID=UPI0029B2184F|nr:SDR family NAD(P)-dependent oxidoreductase [Streptomyces sp. ME18-1-4]MDX3247910.1 SDR family NAD(P)-dependent oxidoreductase [Streptomyces sp. ME18-1-4]
MTEKVWFMTGCSRGFGRLWAEAALKRGDRVVATARDDSRLKPLAEAFPDTALILPLDVTRRGAVFDAVAAAHDHFGRLDVVVNNAGYALRGAVEEVREADVRQLLDTNLLGALWVTQAALPLLREQGSGHVVSVSSMAGLVGEPTLGLYNASKWALEGMMDALSREAAHLGIKVTIIEPGPYATEFASAASVKASPEIPAYDEARRALLAGFDPADVADPAATAPAVFAAIDATEPPLRLALGKAVLPRVRSQYTARLSLWDEWADVSARAHGNL